MGVPCNRGHSQHGASRKIREGHPTGLIRATNSQVITLSPKGYHPIRVLSQERYGAPLRVARELPSLTKPPYFGFSNPISLMGFLGTQGNGIGRALPKWGTLHFLATPLSGAIEMQGNPPRAQTSAPSFKG
jgi:hypothetical protein